MMNGKRLRYSFMTYLLTAVVLSVLSGILCDVRAQGCVNYGGERSALTTATLCATASWRSTAARWQTLYSDPYHSRAWHRRDR